MHYFVTINGTKYSIGLPDLYTGSPFFHSKLPNPLWHGFINKQGHTVPLGQYQNGLLERHDSNPRIITIYSYNNLQVTYGRFEFS